MTIRTLAAVAAFTLAITPAMAADKDLAKCAAMSNSVKRLECYDTYAAKAGAVATTARPPSPGKWKTSIETSKIDDTQNVWLNVDAVEPVYGKFGRKHHPTLYISCRENSTSITMYAGEFLESRGIKATIRIDKTKAKTMRFSTSTSYEHLGYWGGRQAIPFIKSLFGHDNLLVQYTPHGDNPRTAEFPISGLKQAIQPLANACGWKS